MISAVRKIPLAVWLLVVGHAVTDLSQGALFIILPILKAKFSLSYTQVGAVALVQNLTSSVSQPLFGYYSDKRPVPWLMPVGCLLSGAAMFASLWAPNYSLVLLFTAISGLGIAAFHPEAAKTVNRVSGSAKGKGVSFFVVGGNAGFALGSMFMALLVASGEITALTILYIVPSIAISIALFGMLSKLPKIEITAHKVQTTGKVLMWGSLLALIGVVFTRASVSSGVSTFIPLYYVTYLKGDPLYASSLLTVFLASGAVGTLVGGIMSDRYGSRNVMLWSVLPISVLLYLFGYVQGFGVFVLLSLASALLSSTFASALVLAQRMMPGSVGMASGLTIGLSVGLGGMSVLGMGKVADIWGMPLVFDILAFLPILGFIMTIFVQDVEHKNKRSA